MPYIGKKPADIIATVIDTTTGTFSGEVDAGSLDVSGNADIDGITNLDNTDIDGTLNVQGETTLQTHLNMGDNDIIKLGDGADLQIYFNGADGVINESVAGNLLIQGDNIYLQNSAASASYLRGVDGGAVDLRYAGTVKLATTNTGIDVTGTATMDGLTVDGTATSSITSTSTTPLQLNGASIPTLRVNNTGGSVQTDIRSTTSEGLIRTSTNHSLVLGTNQIERMRIDTSGNVGIGTSSPQLPIHVKGGFPSFVLERDAGTGGATGLVMTNSTTNGIYQSGSDETFTVGHVTDYDGSPSYTERMRIDSNGNVGIGTISPVNNSNRTTLALEDVWGGQLDIMVGSTVHSSFGTDNFSSGLSCRIESQDGFTFKTTAGAGELVRIDSSGNLLVGTTSTSPWTNSANTSADNAIVLREDGLFAASRYGGNAAYFNRTLNDGAIVVFNKSGSTVGSIGVNGSDNLFFAGGSGDTRGIYLNNTGVHPASSGGAINDASNDLGIASNRWNNLYLSGGVYLGGTGSANKLDDFEEGEYTVTFTPSNSGSITLNSGISICRYTKIGRLVTITGRVNISSISSPSGDIRVSLPFTVSSGNTHQSDFAALQFITHDVDLPSDAIQMFCETSSGVSYMRPFYVRDNAGWNTLSATVLKGNGNEYFYFNGSYTTNS